MKRSCRPTGRAPEVFGIVLALAVAMFPLGTAELVAQQLASQDSDQVRPTADAQEEFSGTVGPGGAFLRSVLVPGWGHVATESYTRAGFYVTAQAGSLWMLLQTLARKGEAEELVRLERRLAALRSKAAGTKGPDVLDQDPAVQDRQALVDARGQQVEDWAALSVFLVLLGGADAFVAAHLADYPEPLSLDVTPSASGGVELRLSVPVGP